MMSLDIYRCNLISVYPDLPHFWDGNPFFFLPKMLKESVSIRIININQILPFQNGVSTVFFFIIGAS